jgi:hypothetical protein
MIETSPVRQLAAAIVRGLADVAAGRTWPAEEVFDLKAKYSRRQSGATTTRPPRHTGLDDGAALSPGPRSGGPITTSTFKFHERPRSETAPFLLHLAQLKPPRSEH